MTHQTQTRLTAPAGSVAQAHHRQRLRLIRALAAEGRALLLGPGAAEVGRELETDAEAFEVTDPAQLARRLAAASDDGTAVVVWLEGWVAVREAEDVDSALRALGASGTRLVVGVAEVSPATPGAGGPVGGHTHRELAELLADELDGVVVPQRAIEVAVTALPGTEITASVPETPAPASAHLVCVNVSGDVMTAVAQAADVTIAPVHGAHRAALEAANLELREANARLARDRLGRFDSGAATVVSRLERRASRAEAEVLRLEERLEQEKHVAYLNDSYFQAARRRLNAPQHRAVDAATRFLAGIPVLGAVLRRVARALRG